MSRVNYPASSAYSATPQSPSFIGRYRHRDIPVNFDDTTYTIEAKYNHRPDLLAYDLYGNPAYFWVFCSRNIDVIRDVTWDFTTGTVIMVPSQSHVKATFG